MRLKIKKDKKINLTMSFNYQNKRHKVTKSYSFNSLENIEDFFNTITSETGYIFKNKEKGIRKVFSMVGKYKTKIKKRLTKKEKEKRAYDKLGNILTGILDSMYSEDLKKLNN